MGRGVSDVLKAWADHDHALASIAAEMIGAADYFDEHPDYATDERLAEVFRMYVGRLRDVERPS